MDARRLYPWLIRAVWLVLPFAAGPAFGAGLHPYSEAVRLSGTVLGWVGWAVVLVGTLVPYPLGLTALRMVAPAAVLAAMAAVLTGRPSTLSALGALFTTVLSVVVAFAPPTGALYVNGPAYPNERRYPLRPPGPLLLGPLQLSWALAVGAPVAGIVLLAARAWIVGAAVLVVGVPAAVILARSLHSLARRWLVFVPAGVVLHDPLNLLDPVLFPRQSIETLRAAPAGSDSLDLTKGALGLALELVLLEKVPMTLLKPGTRAGQAGASARLLFTPTRPGQVLAEAARRRVPVG
ncbi:MAG: hypothetical protein M3N98_02365 [Actinomycetota bacterium]|nr:hypothetical protein [Actinomycetota bacterium]